jgi:flagellin FlaB
MKVNNNTEIKQDNYAAIGIGAMIVFISLILVAAVASAVIIQTAEKLQQNAQKTGDDTSSELRAKLNVLGGYLDDQGNDNYVLFVKLAAGSEPVTTSDVIVQMQCDGTQVVRLGGATANLEQMDSIDDGIADAGTILNDRGYAMEIGGDAACNAVTEIAVFIHIKGAGSTYEVLSITDRTDGAPII